jgi:bifunctional non-homologous end joining protein LigD
MALAYRPMLATTAEVLPSGDDWAAEIKWDGIRAGAFVAGGQLRLVTRNGNDVTVAYPELRGLGPALGRDALLDGEIVTADERGNPSFERLQRRMHVRDAATIAHLAAEIPVQYLAFDVLELDGRVRIDEPWLARRDALDALDVSGAWWQAPPASIGGAAALFELTERRGVEGVVVKHVASRYELGRRSTQWRKVKHFRSREFVVGGYEPGSRGRAGTVGALLLGVYDGDDLVFVGEVGTGFTRDSLAALHAALERIRRPTSPFSVGTPPRHAVFVEPVIVVEVRYAHFTGAGIVRAPSFRGVRPDIEPRSVVRDPG